VFLGSAKKEVLILIFRARQKEFQKKFRFCCNILILESKKKKRKNPKKRRSEKSKKEEAKEEAETRSQKEASEQRTHGGRRLRALLLLSGGGDRGCVGEVWMQVHDDVRVRALPVESHERAQARVVSQREVHGLPRVFLGRGGPRCKHARNSVAAFFSDAAVLAASTRGIASLRCRERSRRGPTWSATCCRR
jgi:hypothetical protein